MHRIQPRYRHSLNTSIVEGINSSIKITMRHAYDYRDQGYFLKIRPTLPAF